MPGHGAHARREVDLASFRAAGRTRRGDIRDPRVSPTAPTSRQRWPQWRRWGPGVERRADGSIAIHGGRARLHRPEGPLECGNSGTSMRLLAGLVAGFPWETELVGDASLSARPMDRVAEPLELMGAHVAGRGERCLPPLRVHGGELRGIDWTFEGGQRAGEVGHFVGGPVGLGHHDGTRGRDHPHPYRGDAGRRGRGHHGRAMGRGTGGPGARFDVAARRPNGAG